MGANQRDESLWPKCLFWIKQCARFCSGERAPNSKYCINHIHQESKNISQSPSGERKRVVCPIDPTHTVFEDKLQKHIRVCNKTKKEEANSSCSYFVPSFNCGNVETPKEIQFETDESVIIFMSISFIEASL